MDKLEKKQLKGENQTSKLEAVKNLIFGDNIIEYDSAFVEIKKEIESKKKSLENYIAEVKKDLDQHIDSVSTDVNVRITDLEKKLDHKVNYLETKKIDKKQLGKLFVALGEKIGN